MTIKFSKEEMKIASRKIRKYIRENEKQPATLMMTDLDDKERTLTQTEYCGLFDNMASFWYTHGRLPNYTTLLYESATAYRGNPQPNSWTCGSTSLANSSTQIFQYVSEKQCREACNTTTNGTTPANLIKGGKKLGFEVKPIQRTYNAVRKAINSGYGVIAHIETGGNTRPDCLGFQHNFGHYINIYNTTGDYKFKIYDPTKGYKLCNAQKIIKATNGRNLKFYSVKALN